MISRLFPLTFLIATSLSAIVNAAEPAINSVGGGLFIDNKNSMATLVFNETAVDGDLSKFYDKLGVVETAVPGSTIKSKEFTHSTDRFQFSCKRASNSYSGSDTSCTFTIKAGKNSDNLNTTIAVVGNERTALISFGPVFSKEMDNIFPGDFTLTTPENVSLEITGTPGFGTMSVGFSQQ